MKFRFDAPAITDVSDIVDYQLKLMGSESKQLF